MQIHIFQFFFLSDDQTLKITKNVFQKLVLVYLWCLFANMSSFVMEKLFQLQKIILKCN